MIPALKQKPAEPTAVVPVALGMTILIFIEVLPAPWRPWFFVSAGLALAIPLWLGAYRFGDFPEPRLIALGRAVF